MGGTVDVVSAAEEDVDLHEDLGAIRSTITATASFTYPDVLLASLKFAGVITSDTDSMIGQ